MPFVDSWKFVTGQKRHTQDGTQLVILMKSVGKGLRKVRAIDVGCGDGIISYDILRNNKATSVVSVDILKEAAAAAQHNLKDYANEGRAEVHRSSAESIFRNKKYWESFDRFVINPPFFATGTGQMSKNSLDQFARHETSLTLKGWVRGAGRLLKHGGELYCVFPSERLAELLPALTKQKIEPKEIWWLKDDLRKRRFFLRAVRGAKPGMLLHLNK